MICQTVFANAYGVGVEGLQDKDGNISRIIKEPLLEALTSIEPCGKNMTLARIQERYVPVVPVKFPIDSELEDVGLTI